MSDLQIALAVLGVLVIGAVYAFNVWQERKLRQRLESAFADDREDVLLKERDEATARIEPRLGDGAPGQGGFDKAPQHAASVPTGASPDGADSEIEYVVEISLEDSAGASDLHELHSHISAFGKPARLLAWDARAKAWRVLGRNDEARSDKFQAALLLVNRSGPVNAPQLGGFFDAVQAWAARHEGSVVAMEQSAALEIARDLDVFCGNVDVAISLNVVAQPGSAFAGDQIAAAADESGFMLESDGVFHWRDEEDNTLFTMENHENEPFEAERLTAMQTAGLTLLLDVPRIARGEEALEKMADIAGELAAALGGFVVDDNRVALQPAGLQRIKQQVGEIHQIMAEHDIPAGGSRAQRLFA